MLLPRVSAKKKRKKTNSCFYTLWQIRIQMNGKSCLIRYTRWLISRLQLPTLRIISKIWNDTESHARTANDIITGWWRILRRAIGARWLATGHTHSRTQYAFSANLPRNVLSAGCGFGWALRNIVGNKWPEMYVRYLRLHWNSLSRVAPRRRSSPEPLISHWKSLHARHPHFVQNGRLLRYVLFGRMCREFWTPSSASFHTKIGRSRWMAAHRNVLVHAKCLRIEIEKFRPIEVSKLTSIWVLTVSGGDDVLAARHMKRFNCHFDSRWWAVRSLQCFGNRECLIAAPKYCNSARL